MKISSYRLTHKPNTCGNCKLFVRSVRDGMRMTMGYCAIRDKHQSDNFVPCRRQSCRACKFSYSPLDRPADYAGYTIQHAEDGRGYTARAEFDSCILQADTMQDLQKLIDIRLCGEEIRNVSEGM